MIYLDELEEKERRYKWMKSQYRWHFRRISGEDGGWHKQQARFYRRSAAKIFTFSEMISRTLRRHTSEIMRNVTAHNVLLRRLMAGDN